MKKANQATKQLGVAYSSNNAGDGPPAGEFDMEYLEHDYCADDMKRIRIAFWNTNGHIMSNGVEAVTAFIKHFRVDIMVLSDVRLHSRAVKFHAAGIREEVRGAAVMGLATSRAVGEARGGGERMNTMGGTMFIVAPRCASNIIDRKADPSGLGVTGYIKVAINQKRLCIISMYRPIQQANPGSSTVLHRLRKFLRKARINKDPTAYVFDTVSHWIAMARRDGYTVVLGGDFNADPALNNSVGNHLRNWAVEQQLLNALRISFPEGYYTHRCDGREVSSIDHVYVGNEEDLVASACVASHSVILGASDHNPVGVALHWPEFHGVFRMIGHDPILYPPIRVELPHYNKQVCGWYTDILDRWFAEGSQEISELSSEQGMYMMMKESVEVTKELVSKKEKLGQRVGFRSSFKGGYSPMFMALKSALRIVLQYRHLVLNKLGKGKRRSDLLRIYAGFVKACSDWSVRYPIRSICNCDELYTMHGKVDSILTSLRLSDRVDVVEMNDAIRKLLGFMHGRKRTEFRQKMSERVAKIEMLRQQNRIGEYFRLINVKDKPAVDLSTITIRGEVVSDPKKIHEELTELFKEWYRMPGSLHEEARKFRRRDYWRELVFGNAIMEADEAEHGSFRLVLFQEACRSKVSEEQREGISDAVLRPITAQEYNAEIHKMASGKAPGPTGVTANMIKNWPESIHNQMLKWLNCVWERKDIPWWWNRAHLRPIPKSGEPSLENLRPLGLYEISRKVLTSIIIKRVYIQWENLNLLNPNQHAFRRGLSTANAIIRLLNVSEDAEEWKSPLGIILWDFRRAFDSIDFNFTRLALVRLGMPEVAMEFMLAMMENNMMAVASPFHLHKHDDEGCNGDFFHQERGTGQGDPPSPIIWIAVFDVLLSMLSTGEMNGAYYAHGKATEVYKVNDIAYADDLVTISASRQAQQDKADIVSTFCACTGMAIAAVKVRVFQLYWTEQSSVVIYNNQWDEVQLMPMTGNLLIKYLGFMLGHKDEDLEAFDITMNYLREAVTHVVRCHAPIQAKMEVYRKQIIPKIMYMAAKAAWDIKRYRKLDAIAARLLKVLGGQSITSASQMMFLPEDECGSGLQPPSDVAQARKWAELSRVLDSNTESALAANGLLERAMRQMSLNSPPTLRRDLVPENREYLKGYINSLVSWGDEVGCMIANTACFHHKESNTPILPYIGSNDKLVLKDVQMCDITVQGELTRRNQEGDLEWMSSRWGKRICNSLTNAGKLNEQPSDIGVILNLGQMYQVAGEYLEVVGKIQGSNPVELLCYQWNECEGDERYLWREAEVLEARQLRLAGAFVNAKRIIVRGIVELESSTRLMARIVSCGECSDPCTGVQKQDEVMEDVCRFAAAIIETSVLTGLDYQLYTDGSYNINAMSRDAILRSNKENQKMGRMSAAVVAIACHDSWRQKPKFVLFLSSSDQVSGVQAYVAEIVALLLAIQVSRKGPGMVIHSDCKAAIETVRRVHAKSLRNSRFKDVRAILGTLEGVERLPDIEWIPSHPERRISDKSLWRMDDWGSYMADMAAKGQLGKLTEEFKISEDDIWSAPIHEAVMSLVSPGTWYWRKWESELPVLDSIIEIHSNQRSALYFKMRDEYRAKRGEDSRWMGSSLALAAKCWKQVASGMLGSNVALKNCLDKYYHGRNRAKGLVGDEARWMAECHVCGMPDSQKHIILECGLNELQEIRNKVRGKVKDAAREEKKEHGKDSKYIARAVDFILSCGFDMQYEQYDRIWTGLWNMSVLDAALSYGARLGERYPGSLSYQEICCIQESICRVMSHLTSALTDLMLAHRLAANVIDEEEGQTGTQESIIDAETVYVDSRHKEARDVISKDNIPESVCNKKTDNVKKGGRRTIYGGKCECLRKRKDMMAASRRSRGNAKEMDAVFSEGCRISVDRLLRREGSFIEDTSHPAGATCFRDHDHD